MLPGWLPECRILYFNVSVYIQAWLQWKYRQWSLCNDTTEHRALFSTSHESIGLNARIIENYAWHGYSCFLQRVVL